MLRISVGVIYKYVCTYTCIKREAAMSLLTIHIIYNEKNTLLIWTLQKPWTYYSSILLYREMIQTSIIKILRTGPFSLPEVWNNKLVWRNTNIYFTCIYFLKYLFFSLLSNIIVAKKRINNIFIYSIYPPILITNTSNVVYLG